MEVVRNEEENIVENAFLPSYYYISSLTSIPLPGIPSIPEDIESILKDSAEKAMNEVQQSKGKPEALSSDDFSFEIQKLDIDENKSEEEIEAEIKSYLEDAKNEMSEDSGLDVSIMDNEVSIDDDYDKLGKEFLETVKKDKENNFSEDANALVIFYEEKESSIKMANEFLKKFPHSIEAKLCLIGWQDPGEKRMEALEELLEQCEDEFSIDAKFLLTDKGRSYLRLKSLLAETYIVDGFQEDGMELIQEVYEEDTLNDFDAGFILSVELGKKGKWPALVKFFEKHKGEPNIVTHVLKAVAYFNMFGNKVKSKQALNDAYALDSTPFDVISGAMSMEGKDDEEFGGADALFATQMLYDLMSKNEKLMRWIVSNVMRREA